MNTLLASKQDNLIVPSVTGTSLLNSTTLRRGSVSSEFTISEHAQVVDIDTNIDLASDATSSCVNTDLIIYTTTKDLAT